MQKGVEAAKQRSENCAVYVKMLEKRLRTLKPKVSDRTILTYATNIRRLRKISPNLDYGEISQFLKTKSPSQAANLLTSVIVLEGRERFGELYKTLNQEAEDVRGNQNFTNSEINNWVTIRQIRKGIERAKFDVNRLGLLEARKHKQPHLTILIRYLLLKFYNEFHWRSDIVSVKVGKHTGENYFHNGKFYLNKFKTSEKFRKRGMLPLVYTPSRGLGLLIKKFLAVRKAQGIEHDYFLFNRSLKPVKRSAFFELMSRATEKYIGKRLGSSMLRHIYATNFLAGDPTLKQKKKFLHDMMQLSLETFESYARRGKDGRLATKPI